MKEIKWVGKREKNQREGRKEGRRNKVIKRKKIKWVGKRENNQREGRKKK